MKDSILLHFCSKPHGTPYEIETGQDERNTEPLPHIQHHISLELFLVIFQKLNEEARTEYANHKYAEDKSLLLPGIFFEVKPPTNSESHQLAGGFIELCWMAGNGKNGSCPSFPSMQVFNKTKSPRQICRMSIYFMIHQVS